MRARVPARATAVAIALTTSAGASASSSPAVREHAVDVADYTLRAVLDEKAHTVHGEGTIRFRNVSDKPVRELWLHLYLNAFKNDRSNFFRERVGGRGSARPGDWGAIDVRRLAIAFDPDSNGGTSDETPQPAPEDLLPLLETHRPGDEDETDARLPLPRDLAPGRSLTLHVAFDDKLPSIVERTGYSGSFVMVGQWFPKLARLEPDGTWAHFPFHHLSEFYADFGTYDITLDVPATFSVGATGPTVESRTAAGRLVERHVQADVHDFAWTAWDHFVALREVIDGVEVKLLYPPGFDRVAKRELAAVRFALPYDSGRYGRYPYPVLTIVHPQEDASEAGGMEYPTLITSGGPFWLPAGVREPEIVAVHELGHQWFYGLVATNESAWPFLDEGLNQYAEIETMARLFGDGSALDLFGLRVSDAALAATGGSAAASDEPVAQPAHTFSSGARYGQLVYARTAAVLATVDGVYGEGAAGQALGVYARRYRFEHPGPEELLAVFAETAGPDAARMLRVALFDKGWVNYSVESVTQESVLVRRRGTLSLPVDVELRFADGSARRELWDGAGDWTRIPWHGPSALRSARVDPDDRILVDQSPIDNSAQAAGQHGATWRWFERLVFYVELALQCLSP